LAPHPATIKARTRRRTFRHTVFRMGICFSEKGSIVTLSETDTCDHL
jgi:hypothetical protein